MDVKSKGKRKSVTLRKGVSLSLAALTLLGPSIPYAVYAENPTKALISEMKKAPANNGAYPTNIVDQLNWDNKGVTDADKDYWSLNQNIGIEPTQKIVRVTTSDPIENVDINYQGYFVDANGRTNLRFVYMEKSAAISAVWNRILLRFDDDLYGKIDFEKSYGIGSDGKEYKLTQSNGKNEKALNINGMVGARTQNRTNIPMNIVLKEGTAFADLGSKNLKIQMRLVDKDSKRIYAFAPKGSSIDYSVYTKQTVIPIANNIDGLFLRGPKEEDGKKFAFQRAVMTEFIANPENYSDTSDLGILRTEYQAERDSTNPKDVKDGKPAGFIQAFDAKLVPYLKADAAGNIAYTNMLDANRKEVKGVDKLGIALENINYSEDKKVAYIVFGQQNFVKDGVKVVTLDKFDGKINRGGFYYTAIDYVVDKKKFQDTFETTGTTKVDFDIMTGWAETNPKGWTIFEKDYDNDFVVDEGESFMIDTTQDPARKQIMIQVGDPEEAFIRTMQGYYSGQKDGQKGFEQIENIGVGLYELTLREGATIKAGEKFRVLIPDAADHQGPVNFLETHNGSKYNQGAAKLKLQADRNINMHLYRKDKGSFKVYYTLKGETEQKVLEFTKGGLWKYNDKDKILDGIPNRGVDPSGGNFWINTKKLEPGKDIIVEAYNAAGEKEENLTSWFKYKPLEKSAEKYERMAWIDHAEDLSSVGIDKSTYVPYQEIFTNDYKTGTDEIYKDPRVLPADGEDFMKKANKIEGFTQYDGGKIRMRYIESDTKTLVGKAEAAANEYNDKGDVVGKDLSQKVTINSKEYDAMPYELDLSTVSELRDADPETGLELKKDMRLIFNASNGSSLPSDWYDTRVKARVLFDATDGQFDDASKKQVKIAPDNVKYAQEDGYVANGFTGDNVKAGTGDAFPTAPTAQGKTFLGWVNKAGYEALGSKSVATSAEFEALDAGKIFTKTTPIESHNMVYAIWSEEKLITFDANGGQFEGGKEQVTDNVADGVNAPAAPTKEGKTFLGWASTPDATKPEDGILDNVTDAKTVYAVWGDTAAEKTADKVQPAYSEADAEVGKPTTITAPSFTDVAGKATPVPADTTFALGKDAPKGATIDPQTGAITYTPAADQAGKPVNIPVVVTYKDGSTDKVDATVQVAPAAPQGLDLKEPAKKVPVVNKDKLTPDEQQAVKDAIKEANKDLGLTDDDITVDDKGNVTVNKDGKEGQLPAAKVVEQKQGLDLTAPVLTEVNDPNALTPDEQKAVIAAVKAANPNLSPKARVEVQKDGTVVVMDDGKVGILTPDKTIKKKEASSAQTKNSFILVPAGQTQGTEAQQEVREHKAYIFGYEDGSVRPMGNITRAEAATMVARLMNYDLTDNSKPNFTDTNGWYNASINAVVKAGIMKGYENGSFKPDAPISRAEFAQLIKGIDKANSGDVPFRDVKGHWAQEAIAQAYANGRISGYPDGTFRPNQKITRAEAAKILNSVFERAVYEAGLDGVHADVKHFADLDKGAWYYYDMVEATNSHHFVRQDAQKVDENWKRVDK